MGSVQSGEVEEDEKRKTKKTWQRSEGGVEERGSGHPEEKFLRSKIQKKSKRSKKLWVRCPEEGQTLSVKLKKENDVLEDAEAAEVEGDAGEVHGSSFYDLLTPSFAWIAGLLGISAMAFFLGCASCWQREYTRLRTLAYNAHFSR